MCQASCCRWARPGTCTCSSTVSQSSTLCVGQRTGSMSRLSSSAGVALPSSAKAAMALNLRAVISCCGLQNVRCSLPVTKAIKACCICACSAGGRVKRGSVWRMKCERVSKCAVSVSLPWLARLRGPSAAGKYMARPSSSRYVGKRPMMLPHKSASFSPTARLVVCSRQL